MCRSWQRETLGETLQAVFDEWLKLQANSLAEITLNKARWTMGPVLADLGSRPVATSTAPELFSCLRNIEAEGKHESAHRAKQRTSQLFRYAVATGGAERDPTQDLRGALVPVVTTNHAAIIDPDRVGQLLRAIDGYVRQPLARPWWHTPLAGYP
jgi:hypothetical protein